MATLTPPGITSNAGTLPLSSLRTATLDWAAVSLATTRTATISWVGTISTWTLPGRTSVYVEPTLALLALPPRTFSAPQISTLPTITRTVGQIWPI